MWRKVCVWFWVGYTYKEVLGGLIHIGKFVRFWVDLYTEESLC